MKLDKYNLKKPDKGTGSIAHPMQTDVIDDVPVWYDGECHRDDLEFSTEGGLLQWILHKIID